MATPFCIVCGRWNDPTGGPDAHSGGCPNTGKPYPVKGGGSFAQGADPRYGPPSQLILDLARTDTAFTSYTVANALREASELSDRQGYPSTARWYRRLADMIVHEGSHSTEEI